VTAFLIDEMFPMAAAALLRDTYGYDAVHVAEAGLRAAEDTQVAEVARGEGRAIVTENVVDFAAERDVVLVFVLKKNLPAVGGQAAALAKVLDRWAHEHPKPYLGPHWPPTQSTAASRPHGRNEDCPPRAHHVGCSTPKAVELVSCSGAHRPADEQYARGEGLAGQAPGEPGTV
jgi:hypothetical protein